MSTRSQTPIVTITTIGEPYRQDRQTTSYPTVRRRVAHPDGLQVQAHHYPQGAIVSMPSDQAFVLEQSGHLQRGEPV